MRLLVCWVAAVGLIGGAAARAEDPEGHRWWICQRIATHHK